MNEFRWIGQLRRRTKNDARVLLGIGDDTAVLRCGKDKDLLFTTDMLVEGSHFRLSEATAFEIGRKALAVNLSDIAAMGGVPTHAVAAVGLPKKLLGSFADGLYSGMNGLARRFHVNLVGGDTNLSDRVVLSVALLGEVEKGKAVKRSGARVGDRVFVTGPLGGSYVSKKHLNFTPRLKEARLLVRDHPIHAMMDISDGLASDARHIAHESGVGLLLEEKNIPVARQARGVHQALTEGEDFELLFTVSEKEAKILKKKFYCVGRVVPQKKGIKLLKINGTEVPLTGGFDHFK